jgi:protein TonB
MFLYRLATTNSRSRMLIAVFLAVAVHMGFMGFEFEPKPVLVPSVSLPRSVSIFLRQSSIAQTPDQPGRETQDGGSIKAELFKAEKEPEIPVLKKESAPLAEPDSSFQTPAMLERNEKQPTESIKEKSQITDETAVAVQQELENAAKDLKPEAGEAVTVQELATQAGPRTAQEKKGVILPGTLQMAYPHYQSNAPPVYPGLARKRGQEGTVILQVLVNKEGRVDDLKIDVSSNFTLLDRAAVAAVKKWSFEPGRRGEERMPMWVRVPVTYKLED